MESQHSLQPIISAADVMDQFFLTTGRSINQWVKVFGYNENLKAVGSDDDMIWLATPGLKQVVLNDINKSKFEQFRCTLLSVLQLFTQHDMFPNLHAAYSVKCAWDS